MSAEEKATFEFDDEFQTAIAALTLRDSDFCLRTEGLILPDYFQNDLEAGLVSLFQGYFEKYKKAPTKNSAVISELLKDGVKAKLFRKEQVPEVVPKVKELFDFVIADRDFIVEKVEEFARHQAVKGAIVKSVDLISKGDYDKVAELVKKANEVSAKDESGEYEYFNRAEDRTVARKEIMAEAKPPTGITTGIDILDAHLRHKGWGRKELSLFMGGPKSGKTTAMIDCARGAAFAGYNVLYATLEVSAEIVAERLDANISEFDIKDLGIQAEDVERRIDAAKAASGDLIIQEYPTGTLSPMGLSRLIARHKSNGRQFDLVVVDYADLMCPNHRSNEPRENLRLIYQDLRAIAQIENLALLSPTQTNREGSRQAVQRMEHVAEDYNKVRTADILISINATDDEKVRKEARLYFVASRNQQDGISIRIKQALERGKFVARVLNVE